MNVESSKLKNYLLGNIPEAERSDFELLLLTDQEFVATIEIAEEELIDDYLDGLLTSDEMVRFEHFFLNSPDRVKQIEFSRQLKNYSKNFLADSKTNELPNTASVDERESSNFFKFLLRPSFAVPIIGLFLLIIVGTSYLIWQSRSIRTGNEIAEINQKDLSNLSGYAALTKLTLISAATRDSTEPKTLLLKSAAEQIFLRLSLPPQFGSDSARVSISYDNQPFLNLDSIKVYSSQLGRDVRIIVPKVKLAPGSYLVEVKGSSSPVESATYVFEVEP